MINPKNISAMSYDFEARAMTIKLKKPEVFDGRNRSEVRYRCTYEKFAEYVHKWNRINNS